MQVGQTRGVADHLPCGENRKQQAQESLTIQAVGEKRERVQIGWNLEWMDDRVEANILIATMRGDPASQLASVGLLGG